MKSSKDALDNLKKARLEQVLGHKNPSFFKRAKERLFNNKINAYTLIKGICLALYLICKKIKKTIATSLINFKFIKILKKTNASSANIVLAFRLTGGIGDFIVFRRAIRDLLLTCPAAEFDIFTNNPKGIEFVFAGMTVKPRNIFLVELFEKVKNNYDVAMIMHHTCHFASDKIDFAKINRHAPRLIQSYKKNIQRISPFKKFMDPHPALDNFIAELAVKQKLTRETLIHYLLDIPYGGCAVDFPANFDLKKYQLTPQKYITIHNGWDTNYVVLAHQATKNYPDKRWASVVSLLKKQLPGMKIVQLGSTTSRPVPGVDVDLLNKTSLARQPVGLFPVLMLIC